MQYPNDTENSRTTYTYDGDLLTAYDGQTITYDGIGNPLTDGRWTYTWQNGRELASMSKSSITWNYTYDVNGLPMAVDYNGTSYYYLTNLQGDGIGIFKGAPKTPVSLRATC